METPKQRKLQRLRCSVQNYDWGLLGRESQAARLFSLNSGSSIEPDKPYAEFWMGTHGSGPSYVVECSGANGVSAAECSDENGVSVVGSELLSLKSWICQNPNVLGDKVVEKWGCDLPFLFKVLSIAKALSIQAHPDKELAGSLHKSLPNVYKDKNHKPEMALAITEFEALCGFVTLEELKGAFQNVPEIVELVGSAAANKFLHISKQDGKEKVKDALQSIFTLLMSANKEMVSKSVTNLKNRLQVEKQVRPLTDKEQLVLKLEKQYPADVGVISAFFFNHVKLHPGEALCLGANEPHAYICGECIECMATSDNVVRAGLTPKLRDVPTLCSMLTYKQGFPEILQGVPLNQYTRRYLPPFDEFEVDHCVLPQGASALFPEVLGPSIFIVTVGEGTMHTGPNRDLITEGDVLFAPANTEVSVTTASELQLYRAGVNNKFYSAL